MRSARSSGPTGRVRRVLATARSRQLRTGARPALVPTHRASGGPGLGQRPLLLACDIDGTILDPGGALRPAVAAALRTVVRSGVHVVLATGRGPLDEIAHLALALGLVGPQITMQGALVMDPLTGEVQLRRLLPRDVVRDALAFAGQRDLQALVSLGDGSVITLRSTGATIPELGEVIRVHLFTGAERHWSARLALGETFLGRASMTWSDETGIDVLPLGTSKGEAVAAMAVRLGIPLDRVAAVGDAHNDIEMLRVAGQSAAMGSAPRDVKAAADVVVGSSRGDGVIDALRWFFPDLDARLGTSVLFAGLRLLS